MLPNNIKRTLKSDKNVRIDVDCDVTLTKDVCVKILENLLKFILYQCQQIPVQVDILEREVQKCKEKSYQANAKVMSSGGIEGNISCSDYTDTRDQIKQNVLKRREALIKKKFDRQRQRWLQKVQNMIDSYRTTLEMLHHVVHNHHVETVLFALGNSLITARNVFVIHFPTSLQGESLLLMTPFPSTKLAASIEKKIMLGLFRAFMSNKEVSALSTCYFSASKVWTAVQKREPLATSIEMNSDRFSLLPKQEFKMSPLARTYNIFFKEKLPKSNTALISMELTPCVNSKLVCLSNKYSNSHIRTSKVSLCTKFNEIDNKFSVVSSYSDDEMGVSVLKNENMGPPLVGNGCDFSLYRHNTITVNSQLNECGDELGSVNTPHKSNLSEVVEMDLELGCTPSPIRKLSNAINEVKFSPIKETLLWYQLEKPINGFKDNFLAHPS